MAFDKKLDPVLVPFMQYIEKEKFMGWDAYDALNSPLLRLFSFGSKYVRAGYTQFFRMSNINFRPLVGIKKGYNPKGIGLFLESYSKLYSISGDETLLASIDKLISILEETKSKGYTGSAWGYNFPWQSRVVYKPRWTPTIVNTAFIGHALLTCYEVTGNEKALQLASSIPDFILNDLNRLDTPKGTICFSYSPVDKEFVHNANMLGASFLIRYAKQYSRPDLIAVAHKSLQYSVDMQNPDGSWFFAILDTHKWVDSFHTGFKLESIRWFIELGEGEKYVNSYEKGVEFYKNNFFLQDGTPKYYHNKVYPIDIHAPAEAIYFFSKQKDEVSKELVQRVMNWTIANMWSKEKSYFYFRKYKKGVNKIPYMRWSESWMLRGLSEYCYNNKTV